MTTPGLLYSDPWDLASIATGHAASRRAPPRSAHGGRTVRVSAALPKGSGLWDPAIPLG